ncbi:ankyrin repeat-containing domain protein [Lasiosphaeria hispida]|uniref:Ankyrin repeat-containing domain protein n=1 Tax=Lasiosphaeria hispida TaxID=260671 RepID=A0AAJ0HGU2_9PEZI|nr:ankyrin repeat-containing domain protein [Lasiosphaeria hispida]
MLAAQQLRLLVGVCAVARVVAETGDDFSNNLFTDLAPLLALFGERVTMQFMSQSTGWADNIILAMAPLGIITAIVGAIRVGGPSWMKAIIERARESRAAAESELMSSTSNELPKDENPVADYAFPCTASGTLLLVLGMLLCAHVVESSTAEKRYRPGKEARVVWLQGSGTVNDQAFKSFAIFPQDTQALVTTSSRTGEEHGQTEEAVPNTRAPSAISEREAKFLESITVAGVLVSICGFVIQFTGLRGMHWSASVAQLGAIITMTLLRALPADDGGWDWEITAVENPVNRKILEHHRDIASPDSWSKAHKLMRIRRDLGELTDWLGLASAEAIALARAIEITMDALFDTLTGEFAWSLTVSGEPVYFRLSREQAGRWKTYSDELESALSLWLYYVHTKEQWKDKKERKTLHQADTWLRAKGTPEKPSLQLLGSHTAALRQDLQSWMPGGAVRVIEVDDINPGNSSSVEVEAHRVVGFASNAKSSPLSDIDICQYQRKSPESPCTNPPCKNALCKDPPLAVESYSPLKTLYAQYMFSAFMWTAAKKMEKPIEDGADIRPAQRDDMSGDSTWQSITLHNARLSKMAQDIQTTGLGSLEEIYLAIIPPLSVMNKLPRADAIIEWTRKHAKPHEQLGHWNEAAAVYLWLFETATTALQQTNITRKATALLMECLKAVTDTTKIRKVQQFEKKDIQKLERLKSTLYKELRSADVDILAHLLRRYKLQSRPWGCSFIENTTALGDEDVMPELHKMAHDNQYRQIEKSLTANRVNINGKDILDWTPLHYAASKPSPEALKRLLLYRANTNVQDIGGRTPLHYACWHNDATITLSLLREGAEINIQDTSGMAPIHYAAMHGQNDVINSLLEAGADVDVVDGLGNTALLWAVRGRTALQAASEGGHLQVVDRLLSTRADVNAAAAYSGGRTALQAASEGGHLQVINQLLGAGADVNAAAANDGGLTALQAASEGGHLQVIDRLLSTGADVNTAAAYWGGRTALQAASEGGHLQVVDRLLGAGADVNAAAAGSGGRTALQAASEGGHLQVVDRLLGAGADVNAAAAYSGGQTALQAASEGGYLQVINRLLGAGADVNAAAAGSGGWTALRAASEGGHLQVVDRLLGAGADVNAATAYGGGQTALRAASEGGHLQVVDRLLGAGADVNAAAAYSGGWTALQAASEGGHLQVVDRLLGAGADVNAAAAGSGGWIALQAASEGGHLQVIDQLLSTRADINAAAAYWGGRTALQAASEGGHLQVVNRLLGAGADVDAATAYGGGRTALRAASEGGHLQVVSRLLGAGADVNAAAADGGGQTALQAASEGGHLQVVNQLLGAGADVNAAAAGSGGWTALQAASEGGHLQVIDRLLGAGADINAAAADSGGRTALQAASEGGHLQVIDRLLGAGADVNAAAADSGGRTALQAASEGGHLQVVDRLLSAGAKKA